MKFQLITSVSALLLSTVSAALPLTDLPPTDGTQVQGEATYDYDGAGAVLAGNDDFPFWNSDSDSGSGDGAVLGPNPPEFSDMFVAIPNPIPDNSAAFRNGRQAGVRQAQQTWQRLGGTCRLAWGSYPDAITTIIQRLQRARQTDRNDGRIAGLRQELQRRMFECNSNNRNPNPPNPPRPNPRNPQVCIRFGNEAARRIAWRHCNPSPFLRSSQGSWLRDCRDVAINQCKGQVATEVQNQCGMPNTRTLRQLQGQCTDKVDSMIRNSSGSGRGSNSGWNAEEEMMLS